MIKITNFQCWARILHFRIFLEPFTSNYPCKQEFFRLSHLELSDPCPELWPPFPFLKEGAGGVVPLEERPLLLLWLVKILIIVSGELRARGGVEWFLMIWEKKKLIPIYPKLSFIFANYRIKPINKFRTSQNNSCNKFIIFRENNTRWNLINVIVICYCLLFSTAWKGNVYMQIKSNHEM